MNIKNKIKEIDKVLLFAVYALTLIGLFAISSATQVNLGYYAELIKQIAFIIIGTGVMLTVAVININGMDEALRQIIAVIIYIGIVVALLAVMFIGSDGGGATRWLQIGPVGIQPSEFAKFGIVFSLASLLSLQHDLINKPAVLLGDLALLGFPILLILKQPNLSTAIIFTMICLIMIFIAGLDYRYIIAAILIGIPLLFGLVFYIKENPDTKLLANHQKKRILAMIYPDEYADKEGYQTEKSIQAVGSGQLTGKGMYNGLLNKSKYVPEPYTDFILAVIGEEYGFLGTMFVVTMYIIIIYRGLILLRNTSDMFTTLLVAGVVALFCIQAMINMGVATGMLPNTGVNLPFVSAGGSSYLASMIGIGLLANVGITQKRGYRY